jgi:fatty acid desaturase
MKQPTKKTKQNKTKKQKDKKKAQKEYKLHDWEFLFIIIIYYLFIILFYFILGTNWGKKNPITEKKVIMKKIKSCVLVFLCVFCLFFGLSFCADFFAFIFCCGLVWWRCVLEWRGLVWFGFVLFFSECASWVVVVVGATRRVRRCE